MPEAATLLAEQLLENRAPHSGRCSGKFLTLLALILVFAFGGLLTWMQDSSVSEHEWSVHEAAVTMPSAPLDTATPSTGMQAVRNWMRSWRTAGAERLATSGVHSAATALPSRSWPGSRPMFGSQTTAGRHTKVTTYAIFHQESIGDLAAFTAQAGDVNAALSMLRDAPSDWLQWYDDKALTFPLTTKATTSGVCYGIGDLCAQGLAGKNISTFDPARSFRSGAAGFVGYGPPAHYWLEFLDKYMSFGGAWWAVIPKIALTQGPMSVVYNTLYSLLIGAFAFRDPRQVLKDVRDAAVPGFISALRFWPAVHLVTFTVIPIELQVLWVDAAEIIWICILSRINNEALAEAQVDEVTQLSTDAVAEGTQLATGGAPESNV